MIYKFTNTDYNYEDSIYYDLYSYYENGGTYSLDTPFHEYECTWDNGNTVKFNRLDDVLLRDGYKKVMGWMFDFRGIWNKYLVNIRNYGWLEYYAPSKMAIRDVVGNYNIMNKIIQL